MSRRLRWVVRIIFWLTIVSGVPLAGFTALGFGDFSWEIANTSMPAAAMPVATRLLLLAIMSPPILLSLAILRQAELLLWLYERGVIFGVENGRLIRRIGQLMIGIALLQIILTPLATIVLAAAGDENSRTMFEPNLGFVLLGIGIVVVGHVMSVGAELADENSLTI